MATQYDLNVQISATDVVKIATAEQGVSLVKAVGAETETQIIWQHFRPLEFNTVQWQSIYGVYASSTQVVAGSVIVATSVVNPALPGTIYPFANGTFGAPTGEIPRNQYGVANRDSQSLTFGLVQGITGAGGNSPNAPINAVPLLTQETATFTPTEKLSIFLSAEFDNGAVVTDVESPALALDFTTETSQTVHYDGESGQFLPGPLS